MIFDVTDVRGTATEILNIKPTNRIKEVANKSVIDKENNIVHIDVEFKLAEPFYYREKEIVIFDIDDGSNNDLSPSYDERTKIRLHTVNSNNREFLRAVYHQELSMRYWHMYLTPGTISDETDLDMVWHIKDSFIIDKNYNFIDKNVELLKRSNELAVFGNNSGTINLFDVNSSRSEKNLSIQEGGEYNASGFTISDYIDVEEDTEYVTYTEYGMSGSTSACICWYKANGQYISGEYLNGTHYNYGLHSPAGAKKCRFSMLTSEKNKMNFIKELDWLNNDRETVEWLPSIKQLKTSLNDIGTVTSKATGTYTTASWVEGQNTCVWSAPETGTYIIYMKFALADGNLNNRKMYKQLQMQGSARRLLDNVLYYDATSQDDTGFDTRTISQPVYASKGQTIIPYIHTGTAGVVFNVSIVGIRLS